MMQRTHLELFEGSRNTVHCFRWVCLCLPHLLLQQSQRERPWMELMEKGLVGKWMKMIAYQMGLPLPSFKLWTAPPKVWFKNDGFIWHLGGKVNSSLRDYHRKCSIVRCVQYFTSSRFAFGKCFLLNTSHTDPSRSAPRIFLVLVERVVD